MRELRQRIWAWSVSYTHLDVYKRQIQQRQLAANGLSTITWINIPVGAGKYPTLLVAGLICLRSTIGFIFLGLLALLVTLITGKTRNGMGIVILLAAIAGYVKLYMNDVFTYWNSAHPIGNKRSYIRISKATITPLFTTCLKSDEFMPVSYTHLI